MATRTTKTRETEDTGTNPEPSKREQEKAEAAKRAEEQKAEREAKAAERKAEQEAKKAEREAAKAAEKEAKDKEREEAKAKKAQEANAQRQARVDSGDLIEVTDEEGGTILEYNSIVPKKESVAMRAADVIEDLMASELPVSGKDLADKYGGGTVQWVSFFGMLRVLGYAKPYRYKTGNRGEGGLAYLWTGPKDLTVLRSDAAGEEVSPEDSE